MPRRAMAIDHGPKNIRVNSVNPGDTDTAMLRDEGRQTGIVKEEADQDAYLKDCGTAQAAQKNRNAGGYCQCSIIPCK